MCRQICLSVSLAETVVKERLYGAANTRAFAVIYVSTTMSAHWIGHMVWMWGAALVAGEDVVREEINAVAGPARLH